jgi:uncharacterized protein with PIN domain
MKTIAALEPEAAQVVTAFLAKQGIACDARGVTDENGLETTELLVQDDAYEPACEALERWDAEKTAEHERTTSRRCPSCNSPRVEYVEDIDYEKSVTQIPAVYRCTECSRLFVPRK